jgi:hypothetical protein
MSNATVLAATNQAILAKIRNILNLPEKIAEVVSDYRLGGSRQYLYDTLKSFELAVEENDRKLLEQYQKAISLLTDELNKAIINELLMLSLDLLALQAAVEAQADNPALQAALKQITNNLEFLDNTHLDDVMKIIRLQLAACRVAIDEPVKAVMVDEAKSISEAPLAATTITPSATPAADPVIIEPPVVIQSPKTTPLSTPSSNTLRVSIPESPTTTIPVYTPSSSDSPHDKEVKISTFAPPASAPSTPSPVISYSNEDSLNRDILTTPLLSDDSEALRVAPKAAPDLITALYAILKSALYTYEALTYWSTQVTSYCGIQGGKKLDGHLHTRVDRGNSGNDQVGYVKSPLPDNVKAMADYFPKPHGSDERPLREKVQGILQQAKTANEQRLFCFFTPAGRTAETQSLYKALAKVDLGYLTMESLNQLQHELGNISDKLVKTSVKPAEYKIH